MAFIIVNQDTHNIFDINNSILSNNIYNYFSRYQRFERNKVKFITMDLYKPYYSYKTKSKDLVQNQPWLYFIFIIYYFLL